jgi:hypothetical protein
MTFPFKKYVYWVLIPLFILLVYNIVLYWQTNREWNNIFVKKVLQQEYFYEGLGKLAHAEYLKQDPEFAAHNNRDLNAPKKAHRYVYFLLSGDGDVNAKTKAIRDWANRFQTNPEIYLRYFQEDKNLEEVVFYVLEETPDYYPLESPFWSDYTIDKEICWITINHKKLVPESSTCFKDSFYLKGS